MIKNLIIAFTIIVAIIACEKDDFCITNPVTPNLVLRFYDANTEAETELEVDSLYIWADGLDTIHSNQTTDSIAIPINTLATSTTYILAQGTQKLDTLILEYTTEDEYISRSCGFRVIFNDVDFSLEDKDGVHWIESVTSLLNEDAPIINNQDQAHVKIYH